MCNLVWRTCRFQRMPERRWLPTTVMLMASSNWCMMMLMTADASNSRMSGSLNCRETQAEVRGQVSHDYRRLEDVFFNKDTFYSVDAFSFAEFAHLFQQCG